MRGGAGKGVYITDLDLYHTTVATAFETDYTYGGCIDGWWDGMRKFRSWLRFQAWSFSTQHIGER